MGPTLGNVANLLKVREFLSPNPTFNSMRGLRTLHPVTGLAVRHVCRAGWDRALLDAKILEQQESDVLKRYREGFQITSSSDIEQDFKQRCR